MRLPVAIVVAAAFCLVGVAACNLLPVRGDNDCLNSCLRSCPPPSSSPTRESPNSQQSPCESDCVTRCR